MTEQKKTEVEKKWDEIFSSDEGMVLLDEMAQKALEDLEAGNLSSDENKSSE